MLRIGHGYDSHRLIPNRPLVLGGVSIPHDRGLEGHSDADALLHAVIDAILGALALGDIGQWFPPSSPEFKDADSRKLLKTVLQSDPLKPWKLVNLDATILAEQPRLQPHIDAMRHQIASLFNTDIERVSVKATTNEGLDAVGRGEGIAVHCVVLMEKIL